jgi:hypothetical protein
MAPPESFAPGHPGGVPEADAADGQYRPSFPGPREETCALLGRPSLQPRVRIARTSVARTSVPASVWRDPRVTGTASFRDTHLSPQPIRKGHRAPHDGRRPLPDNEETSRRRAVFLLLASFLPWYQSTNLTSSPSRSTGARSKEAQVHVRLPTDLKRALKIHCVREGTTEQALVVALIKAELQTNARDLMRERRGPTLRAASGVSR